VRWAVPPATAVLFLVQSLTAGPGVAQELVPVNPDSVLEQASLSPIGYDTSYNRDLSTGTWTQVLSYGLNRGRLALNANGSSTTVAFPRSPGLGGRNGSFGGSLFYRATGNWIWTLNGTFNRVVSTDVVSETSQRQNRLKINSQYTLTPVRAVSLTGIVSSEFQQDHGLTVRPLGQERLRLLTRYNAAGDSVGVDSIFVHDQRDSTYMSGRQDGATVLVAWNPKSWLQMTGDASGTRVNPVTTSQLRDFARALDGSAVEAVDRSRFESPNTSESYQTKVTFTGIRRMTAWANARGLHNTQQYFDKSLRNQEQLSLDQRFGILHAEFLPILGLQVGAEASTSRSLSGYALRANRSSLVTSRSVTTFLSYMPSPRSRAGVTLNLDNQKNERQANGNGTNISRLLQVSGGHRVSSRLSLDAAGTVSLTSFQYVDSILDQDNARTYVNVGGGYTVSDRCSTLVHFSATRGHTVAIDPSRSGNNNVQSTYQMDAILRVGVSRTLSIIQNYLLNAIYQIYDDTQSESRSVLSRIRRIDTTVADSLFTFASIRVNHNFLFLDSGSFTKPPGGERREYNVGSETYQQTFGATLGIQPAGGVGLFVTQSLANTKTNFPSAKTKTVDNRWNLTFGATVQRSLPGGASITGSAQHIGSYTEARSPLLPRNEQDDWLAGVTFHKDL